MVDINHIEEKLERNIDQIKKYGVKKIGVFGSYAKGLAREGSDIDIIVEFEAGKKTFDNYMDLKFFLEGLFNCKVDLVIVDSIKPELKREILTSIKYVASI